jgi:hypothetical protein
LTGIVTDVSGNLTVDSVVASGNVSAANFLGDGSELTGVLHAIPTDLDVVDVFASNSITTADIFVSNAVTVAEVIAAGNVSANVFIGDGSQLTGIVSLTGEGKVPQSELDGFLVVPQGYTANTTTRLALGGGGLPVGSLVRQVDSNVSYMLSTTPSNVDINWFVFTGLNFPVNTVFGRVGDIQSSFGDYFDDYIELSADVGPVQTGNSVSAALSYLAGQISALSAFVGF